MGSYLDPTDLSGRPTALPAPGPPWLPVDPGLSRINEPPAGSGAFCNVEACDDPADPGGVMCMASMDIREGEELLMDYGRGYNRSGYQGGRSEGRGW